MIRHLPDRLYVIRRTAGAPDRHGVPTYTESEEFTHGALKQVGTTEAEAGEETSTTTYSLILPVTVVIGAGDLVRRDPDDGLRMTVQGRPDVSVGRRGPHHLTVSLRSIEAV